jgi:hypothetical protein
MEVQSMRFELQNTLGSTSNVGCNVDNQCKEGGQCVWSFKRLCQVYSTLAYVVSQDVILRLAYGLPPLADPGGGAWVLKPPLP